MVEEKQSIFYKVKKKLKAYFKSPKDVIYFFLPIIIALSLLIPLPYYVRLGGGIIELDNKIKINESGDNGYFGALYVRESKAVVLTYLMTYIVPSFEREKVEKVVAPEEDTDSYDYREKLYFTSSIDAATKVAFEKAGRNVKISSSKFLIIYIDKDSKTELLVGDEISKINGKKVTSYDDMLKLLRESGDSVSISVNRDGKEVTTKNSFMEIDGEKKLGIVISNEIKYSSNPKVKFKFNGKEAGPSGGLMIALSIYDKLCEKDITHGKKIVGTGTIDTDGNVGEIGGVKYKLAAASRKKAEIVFVPSANYEEAKKLYDENEYSFKLVSVKTFDEAINYLNGLN